MTGPAKGETLWLIDANNIVHRLYHAVPPEQSPSGQAVNAVTGWLRSLRAFRKRNRPRWVLPIFDGDGPRWRRTAGVPRRKRRHRQGVAR